MRPEDIALSNCEKEPVHIPGRIQSFGTLLAYDVKTELISHVAANFSTLLPQLPDATLGGSLSEALRHELLAHDIRGALSLPWAALQRERLGVYPIGGVEADVAVHSHNGTAIVEFEPIREADNRPDSAIVRVRSMLANIASQGDVDASLISAVLSLRCLTGFDRVMGYRFLPNGDGEVAAEACGPSIEPFLGLRYPAWDIPTQVREIALRMPFRMIADVDDPHVDVLMAAGAAPLDMTRAHMRGVSPIHVEYLKNMGVGSSMNCSIIVHGSLWGLFAFHHYRAKVPPPNYRSICEMFSQMFSSHLEQQLERELVSHAKRAHSMLVKLETADNQLLGNRFEEIAPDFLKALEADGVAYRNTGGWKMFGQVPTPAAIDDVAKLAVDEISSFESLTANGMPGEMLGTSAGALIVPLSAAHESCLVFFRNEIITEVRWAGTREKTITHGPLGPRLNPRSSFAEYKEAVHGRGREWSRADLTAAGEIRTLVLEVLNRHLSSSEQEWRNQRKQQDLLIAELNHRVKNILALVRSIARQTKDSASSTDDFVDAFESRIRALAFAHDLVGGRGGQQASLGELLRAELRPYEIGNDRVAIDGEPIALRPDTAPVMALVFHELATNAAKYGALASDDGHLRVTWRNEAGGVAIEWNELLTTKLAPPTRRGFGLELIERAIPYECHGESEVHYRSDGLEVRMWLPHEALATYLPPVEMQIAEAPIPATTLTNFGRALVVEDNMILTMELERLLTELGCEWVDSVPNSDQGLKALASKRYDVAILDVNLGRGTSFELAEASLASGVPVLFVTGYGAQVELPENLVGTPCLSKPIDKAMLAARLSQTQLQLSE